MNCPQGDWHFTIHNSPFIIQNCVCSFPQFPSRAPNAAPRMSYTPASPCAASTTFATTAIPPSNSKPARWVNCRKPLRCLRTLTLPARPPLARAVGKLECLPSSIAKDRDTCASLARRSWRSISRKFRLDNSGFDRKILELPVDASSPRQRESTPGKMDPRFRRVTRRGSVSIRRAGIGTTCHCERAERRLLFWLRPTYAPPGYSLGQQTPGGMGEP